MFQAVGDPPRGSTERPEVWTGFPASTMISQAALAALNARPEACHSSFACSLWHGWGLPSAAAGASAGITSPFRNCGSGPVPASTPREADRTRTLSFNHLQNVWLATSQRGADDLVHRAAADAVGAEQVRRKVYRLPPVRGRGGALRDVPHCTVPYCTVLGKDRGLQRRLAESRPVPYRVQGSGIRYRVLVRQPPHPPSSHF